jgi:hypothetical protein
MLERWFSRRTLKNQKTNETSNGIVAISIAVVCLTALISGCVRSVAANSGNGTGQVRRDVFDTALSQYAEFLQGKRGMLRKDGGESISLVDLFDFEIEHYIVTYAIIDMNRDAIPELLVRSMWKRYILTYRDDSIYEWCFFGWYGEPNDNGTVTNTRRGGAPGHTDYSIEYFDYWGNNIESISFSLYDLNEDGIYDEKDNYYFEGVEVIKREWDELTKKYFDMNSGHIQWHTYKADDTEVEIIFDRLLCIDTIAVTNNLAASWIKIDAEYLCAIRDNVIRATGIVTG